MTYPEFEPIMMPMRDKWGKYAFDGTKFDLVFQEVKDLLPSQFRRIVAYFLGEDVKAKVSDFKRSAQFYRRKPTPEHQGCQNCCDGIVVANYINTGYPSGFRCGCDAGRRLSASIPVWENNPGYKKKEMR